MTSQLDKASIIRLTISYLKYHELLGKPSAGGNAPPDPLANLIGEELGSFLLQVCGVMMGVTPGEGVESVVSANKG